MEEKKSGNIILNSNKSKHNTSAIIIVSILMVLVLIAIILLIFYYFSPKSQLSFDSNIKEAALGSDKSQVYISLNEGVFNSSVDSVKFAFKGKEGEEYFYTTNQPPGAFPFLGKTYNYFIDAKNIGLVDFSGIRSIYLALTYKAETKDTKNISSTKTNQSITNATRRSGGGGGGGGGGTTPTVCKPKTCADYSGKCGISYDDGCGGKINCLDNCAGKGYYCYFGEGIERGLCLNISQDCEDSDGLDEYTKGSFVINSTVFEETCQEANLSEYYCYYNGASFELRNKTIECALGCNNGECNYEDHPYILKRNFGIVRYNPSSLKGADSGEVQELGSLFSGLINGSSAVYYIEGVGDILFVKVAEFNHTPSIKEFHEAFMDYYGEDTRYDYDSLEYYGFNGYILAVGNASYGDFFLTWVSDNKTILIKYNETIMDHVYLDRLEQDFMSSMIKYFYKHNPTLNGYCRDSDSGKDYNVWGSTEDYIDDSITLGWGEDHCSFNSNKLFEGYCQDNLSTQEEYNCPVWCKEGKCIDFVDYLVCEDSDGGINYGQEGQVEMYYNVTKEKYASSSDRCFDSKGILEAFCNESVGIDYNWYDCSSEGKICVNNSCVDYFAGCGNGIIESGEVCDGFERGDLDCQDYGYNSGWVRGCCGCTKPDLFECYNETRTCKDNDGKDFYTASNISYCYSSFSGESCSGTGGASHGCWEDKDSCDGSILYEKVCTADNYTDQIAYNCSKEGKVCSGGRCIDVSEICTDYDGLDYYNKSYVNFTLCYEWGDCENYSQSDCCNGNVLIEKTCSVSELDSTEDVNLRYNCSSEGKVCQNGACVNKFNGCGNNLMDAGEVCDGLEMNGKKCTNFGYDNGTLRCCNTCNKYLFNSCYNSSWQCVDNDGGLNTTQWSYVDSWENRIYGPSDCVGYSTGCSGVGGGGGGGDYSGDYCVTSIETGESILMESICDANNRTSHVEYNCSIDGKVCYDGKCVYEIEIELHSLSFVTWILDGLKSLLGLD